MRILLATDAWFPQVNGVVRTLSTVTEALRHQGHEVEVVAPDRFRTIPCPGYAEIRLATNVLWKIGAIIRDTDPDAIHIATEGPIGFAVRRYCVKRGIPFTTAFHTRFPEYIHARTGIPVAWGYSVLRWFHRAGIRMMVATETLRQEMTGRGIDRLAFFRRGVDAELFRPRDKAFLREPRPIWLFVGRVAVEKNIAAFLDLDLPGTKYVVGDGPSLESLRRRYPGVRFAGAKHGEELARHFAAADVFVFPSRTDTYGLVLLEALASGLPVAAFPVPGPLDVIGDAPVGVLDEDLRSAALRALEIPGARCREFALRHSWESCAAEFLGNLARISRPKRPSSVDSGKPSAPVLAP